MGGIIDGIFGGDDAAGDAADAQRDATMQAVREQRRQFDLVSRRMEPFISTGRNQGRWQFEQSTIPGLNDRLAHIMNTDAFNALYDEGMESARNQFSQSGLQRSGAAAQAAARLPASLAMQIDDQLWNRMQQLTNNSQNAAANLGAQQTSMGGNIGNLYSQMGQAQAQGIIGAQQANAGMASNLLNTGLTAAFMFSDETLKENIEPVGRVGDLTVYEWDWKPEIADIVGNGMSTGFLAQEVEQAHPEYVVEVDGIKMIDYPGLLAYLESEAA